MRGYCIFSGSSHPTLVEAIAARLGQSPASASLKKFSNGETSVEISTSKETFHLFTLESTLTPSLQQTRRCAIKMSSLSRAEAKSGSSGTIACGKHRGGTRSADTQFHSINDDIMELLIMISACKGGSARSITGTTLLYF